MARDIPDQDSRAQVSGDPILPALIMVGALTALIYIHGFVDPSVYRAATDYTAAALTGGILEVFAVVLLIGVAYLTRSRLVRDESADTEVNNDG